MERRIKAVNISRIDGCRNGSFHRPASANNHKRTAFGLGSMRVMDHAIDDPTECRGRLVTQYLSQVSSDTDIVGIVSER